MTPLRRNVEVLDSSERNSYLILARNFTEETRSWTSSVWLAPPPGSDGSVSSIFQTLVQLVLKRPNGRDSTSQLVRVGSGSGSGSFGRRRSEENVLLKEIHDTLFSSDEETTKD